MKGEKEKTRYRLRTEFKEPEMPCGRGWVSPRHEVAPLCAGPALGFAMKEPQLKLAYVYKIGTAYSFLPEKVYYNTVVK